MSDERPLPSDRVAYSPIIDRPQIRWPDGARVAFWVAPNIEFYEYLPPRDGVRNPWPRSPHPDVQGYAERERWNVRDDDTNFSAGRDYFLRRDSAAHGRDFCLE